MDISTPAPRPGKAAHQRGFNGTGGTAVQKVAIAQPIPRPTMAAPAVLPPRAQPAPPGTPADFDRLLHVWQSQFTAGRSPSTVGLAVLDWAVHAANTPFQTAALGRTAMAQWMRLAQAAMGGKPAIAAKPDDHRFADPAWQRRPYDLLTQAVLLGEEWWESVVQTPGGIGRDNKRIVAFTVRQWLDLMSPSNLPWVNPEVIDATRATAGANLAAGLVNFLRDQKKSSADPGVLA